MNTKKIYAILNMLVIASVTFSSIFSNRNRGGEISSANPDVVNYFSPAGYAFSIWFLIYIALFAFAVHQLYVAFGKAKDEDTILKVGPWLILALGFNALWSYVWLNGYVECSPVLIFASFACLMVIVVRLKMQLVSVKENIRRFTWIPISLFSGWMMAAATVGLSTFLSYKGLGNGDPKTMEYWTVAIIVIVGCLYYFMLRTRRMAIFALVGVWTLIAISVDHWGKIPILQWCALVTALILLGAIIFEVKNRKKVFQLF